jgi:hypothetical protein
MTVDASRSCLGLATSVGSAIRQIVVSRILLTAAAPPALPGSTVFGALRGSPAGNRCLPDIFHLVGETSISERN